MKINTRKNKKKQNLKKSREPEETLNYAFITDKFNF